jgi:hypothetical protein
MSELTTWLLTEVPMQRWHIILGAIFMANYLWRTVPALKRELFSKQLTNRG